VIERIRKVGDLLATLKAPFLVMADDQSAERNAYSGRVYEKGCPTLTAAQWKHIGNSYGAPKSGARVWVGFGVSSSCGYLCGDAAGVRAIL
jgi:hypothetical protein